MVVKFIFDLSHCEVVVSLLDHHADSGGSDAQQKARERRLSRRMRDGVPIAETGGGTRSPRLEDGALRTIWLLERKLVRRLRSNGR